MSVSSRHCALLFPVKGLKAAWAVLRRYTTGLTGQSENLGCPRATCLQSASNFRVSAYWSNSRIAQRTTWLRTHLYSLLWSGAVSSSNTYARQPKSLMDKRQTNNANIKSVLHAAIGA